MSKDEKYASQTKAPADWAGASIRMKPRSPRGCVKLTALENLVLIHQNYCRESVKSADPRTNND